MERFTKKDENGLYQAGPGLVEQTGQAYRGPAIERLGQVEDLVEFLTARQEQLSRELGELRVQGKTRSAQFRDKMAQKLTNGQILSALGPAFSGK